MNGLIVFSVHHGLKTVMIYRKQLVVNQDKSVVYLLLLSIKLNCFLMAKDVTCVSCFRARFVQDVQKHSAHTLVFRSLKRTHEYFVSDQTKPPARDETA